jgi:hypothetical protein
VVELPPGGSDPLHGWGSAKAALDKHKQKTVNKVMVMTVDIVRMMEQRQDRGRMAIPHSTKGWCRAPGMMRLGLGSLQSATADINA